MTRRLTFHKLSSFLAMTLFCLAVTGCGDGLSGSKYTEKDSKDGIEFKSGHKAYVTVMGSTVEATYAVDGDKITLDGGGQIGKLVVTRAPDGTITGLPMTGPLHRQ
jgi:hypothetical protein